MLKRQGNIRKYVTAFLIKVDTGKIIIIFKLKILVKLFTISFMLLIYIKKWLHEKININYFLKYGNIWILVGGKILLPSDKKQREVNVSRFCVKKFVSYVKSNCEYLFILSDTFESLEFNDLVR